MPMFRFKPFRTAVFAAGVFLCTSCTSLPDLNRQHPEDRPWTLSGTTERLGGRDPIEPFNRVMFTINDAGMMYVVRPVSYVYASILPKECIKRLNMVSDNLAFPGRMFSCFLQAKWKHGGTEFLRFLINSTVGIAGIFDPGEHFFSWRQRHENMGHAFAAWGIGPGCVVMLPFLPSTNMRDHIGSVFDMALDIKFYLPYASTIAGVNRAVSSMELYSNMRESQIDPYEYYKMVLLVKRYIELNDFPDKLALAASRKKSSDALETGTSSSGPLLTLHPVLPELRGPVVDVSPYYDSENRYTDTLRVAYFTMKTNRSSLWLKHSFWNTDFVRKADEREVFLNPFLRPVEYRFWRSGGGKLVVLIPGVGTHYTGMTVNAFAELFHQNGYNVVAMTSPMSWSFAEAAGIAYPGYTPDDASAARSAIDLIVKDLKKKKNFIPEQLSIVGYSLGGLHALHIAAMEATDPRLKADRYLALNPPVSLQYSLQVFDSAADASRVWETGEFFKQFDETVPGYLARMSAPPKSPQMPPSKGAVSGGPSPYRLGIPQRNAAVMLGLSFRLTMREILMSASQRGLPSEIVFPPYAWSHRFRSYEAFDQVSGMEYARKCLFPSLIRKYPGSTWESVIRQSGLHAVEKQLRDNPKVRVIHNTDDPILSPSDALYLDALFSKRMIWFDQGGHLGNLYLEEYQRNVLEQMP